MVLAVSLGRGGSLGGKHCSAVEAGTHDGVGGMTWTLIVVLLSSGVYEKKFANAEDCIAHLHEFAVITKTDLWMGRCDGPHNQAYIAETRNIGP